MKVASFIALGLAGLLIVGLVPQKKESTSSTFYIEEGDDGESLSVYRTGSETPILTQNAKAGMRPYLHPIMSPDGNGSLTEYSPGHHKHQTGLYWGFTRVNGSGAPLDTLRKWFYRPNKPDYIRDMIGRDFFHNNGETHWNRVHVNIEKAVGEEVSWQTVYHMLDEAGEPILEETMAWSFKESGSKHLISLAWQGKAIEDITINGFEYGGMFLRMPWRPQIAGEAINAAGQRNQEAEGQNSEWVDVGMAIEGRDDWGHIAILDHPSNPDHPTPWRVDGQLGVGPCRALGGDWHIEAGQTATFRHQLVAYTGQFDAEEIQTAWNAFASE